MLIESDHQLVVTELLQPAIPNSAINNLLLDIRDIMSELPLCNIQFNSRMGNVVAHKLARNACFVNYTILCYGKMSDFILQALWFDKQSDVTLC